MDDSWKNVAELLPLQPCDALQETVMMDIYDSGTLGENLLLYHRESVETAEQIKAIMTPEDWERHEHSVERHWGARCTCTRCGDEFTAGWKKGGIVLTMGEDGADYSGWVSEEEENAVVREDGDLACCPHCWAEVRVTPRRELRNGRTYRILQAEVVNIEEYTAVMYWMVTRYQNSGGYDATQFVPHQALVIDRMGKIRRFRAKRNSQEVTDVRWEPCTRTCDPMQQPYYSACADYGKNVGGWVTAFGPDLTGHTGEKTALIEYIGADGAWPGAYLHVWQKRPQVENLMRQGFAKAVREEIDDRLDGAGYYQDLCDAPPIPWVDWRETKPHRMLGMSREAFRVIRNANWNAETAKTWAIWRAVTGNTDALAYEMCRSRVGAKDVRSLLEMMQAGWNDFEPVRVVRYLEKKDMLRDGVRHLIDYRVMLRDAGLAETSETLWPKDLIEAHDRTAEMLAKRRGLEASGSFAVTRIKLDGLEWTDGKLCIVIPKAEQELIDEGRILRHCVGSYGDKHCNGRPVFFVRKYRRPERSYYTLNINMTGTMPERIQLHGYGNEHHGDCKQYKHSIPREVLEFCDRWEREVLIPWWNEKRRVEAVKAEPGGKRKKRKKEKKAA